MMVKANRRFSKKDNEKKAAKKDDPELARNV